MAIMQFTQYAISFFMLFFLAACSSSRRVTPIETQIEVFEPTPMLSSSSTLERSSWQQVDQLGRGTIYNISLSPDEKTLVVTTTIGVWMYSMADGEILHFQEGEALKSWWDYSDITWSPDGSMLAVGKRDNGVWVWRVETWELIAERASIVPGPNYKGGRDRVYDLPGVAWSPDGQHLAVGTGLDAVWVWDTNHDTWEDWSNYNGQQTSLVWTQDNQLLMFGFVPEEGPGIFDVTTGALVTPLYTHVDGCCSKAFWSPGHELLAVMFDLGGGVYDVYKNEYAFWVGTYPTFAWSPSGNFFATFFNHYEEGPILWVYDAETFEIVLEEEISSKVDALTWTADDELLAVGLQNDGFVLWNVTTGEELLDMNDHLSFGIAIENQDHYPSEQFNILFRSAHNALKVWDMTEMRPLFSLEHPVNLNYIAQSLKNGRVAALDANYQLVIWKLGDEISKNLLSGHQDAEYASAISFSPDGSLLATGDNEGYVRIWELDNHAQLIEFTHNMDVPGSSFSAGRVSGLSWSPDGQMLVVEYKYLATVIYDIENLTPLLVIEPDEIIFGDIHFVWMINSEVLAINRRDGITQFWKTNIRDDVSPLDFVLYDKIPLFWSSDGERLFTQSGDDLSIWDFVNRRLLLQIKNSGIPTSVASLSPDENFIATTIEEAGSISDSSTSVVFIWNTETGELAGKLVGHKDRIVDIVWSSDGKNIYTSSVDGTIRVWSANFP